MKEIKNKYFGTFYIEDNKILDSDKKVLGEVADLKVLDDLENLKSLWDLIALAGKEDQVQLVAGLIQMLDYILDYFDGKTDLKEVKKKLFRIDNQYILFK